MNKVKLPACSRAATQDGFRPGCFARICSCGRCEICSLPPSPASQVGQEVDKGCAPKIASGACNAARTAGGIGKTTFIQHIYDQMKSHFQIPIWVCVSLDFNASRLAKEIEKRIPGVDNENSNCSDEELIKQRIKGKRVLLVLDDVWTHDEND